ncbi:MAG: baseplate J/gp47 family protein [Pleurocapsa sp. MO_226.B13]|nr:baseplate J/gp47 family protein [Pleurocapsa sp. MO_226.B13]
MPLELPNLDDRKYDDLVQEALSMIPTYAEKWTNHNPSDPGITLIEMFAYLTEMLLYRQNRVTAQNVHSFLKLLNGPQWQPSGTEEEALNRDKQDTIRKLRRQERAVSCQDFEDLAKKADSRVARVRCLPRRDLRRSFDIERAGHIGLIIVPKPREEVNLSEIISKVKEDLDERRLLTTRLHVVEPQYLKVRLQVTVALLPDIPADDIDIQNQDNEIQGIRNKVKKAIADFLDPFIGGEDQSGWPFGRNLFISEIYQLLDQLPGIDYVTSVEMTNNEEQIRDRRIETQGSKQLVGWKVKPYELLKAEEIMVKIVPSNLQKI